MDEGRTATPRETVRQPGLIWCYEKPAAGPARLGETLAPEGCAFRWLHLNLSDQRSLRWLEEGAGLPLGVRALLLSREPHQRFVVDGDAVGLILQDYERDFDPTMIGRIGSLHVALRPGLVITGRYRPLHSADLFRNRLEAGQPVEETAAALTLLLATLIDSLAALVLDLSTDMLEVEEALLTHDEAPDIGELVGARRRSAQLHRMIGGMRVMLQRLERHPRLPPALAEAAVAVLPRLGALDGDIVSVQNQLKLLRDELDLQAAQRTNANIYLLSMLTALMMPATLVTGFFGMNTGALPFAHGEHGTVMAALVMLISAGATYLLLRMMGLARRQ
ncbi:CorA family divalent cation transporter [Sphingomonas morindae]|uniref:Magnesium transporter CorA n=1 Tax=Sphingomonas morindae TaxID=1541170 RepID=A0ABY4X5A8_9SPHN|nr:CorA family divalent cation transporter [Sphingomonas morindae]USI72070.1 magnesium transporter CorA [Sphingomonas morindae]